MRRIIHLSPTEDAARLHILAVLDTIESRKQAERARFAKALADHRGLDPQAAIEGLRYTRQDFP